MSSDKMLIHNWLDDEIKSKVSQDNIEPLIIELHYLLELLPPSYNEFEDEKQILKDWLSNQPIDCKNKEKSICDYGISIEELRKGVSERPLVGFLAYRSSSLNLNIIRSVYIFVTLKLVELGSPESRINKTLDVIRLLQDKYREFLIPFFPDMSSISSSDELLDYMKALEESNIYNKWQTIDERSLKKFIENQRNEKTQEWSDLELCNERMSYYLYDYILPLIQVINENPGSHRRVKTTNRVIDTISYKDETTGNTINSLSFISEIEDESNGIEVGERQDDERKSIEQVYIAKPTNYYKDKVRADQQVNSRRLRSMSQSTDVNIAHIDEITILIEEALKILSQLDLKNIKRSVDNESNKNINYAIEHQSSLYLLTLLLTGSKDIMMSDDLRFTHNALTYKIIFRPTRSQIKEDWNSNLCAENQEYLLGFLPQSIGYLLSSIAEPLKDAEFIEIQDYADAILKRLNKNRKTKLTLHRVQNYLPHYLSKQGYDQALIDVLINKPIHQLSSLPYFNVSQLDLYSCQQDFNNYLIEKCKASERLNITKFKFLELPEDKEIGYWEKQTGTALAIEDNELKAIVTDFVAKVCSATQHKDLKQLDSIVNIHNIFTDYLYLMLAISTGYRPVREPFGRLEQIDTRTRKYFISDKENHKDSNGRFIYLPKIVIQQLEVFIRYLKYLISIFGRLDNPISEILSNIIESKSGLITYLVFDINDNTASQIHINNVYIHERLSKIVNLPLNWPRHYIRSYKEIYDGIFSIKDYNYSHNMIYDSFGYDTIGSFMGHADELGYDFFDRYSGNKSKELKRFAEKINDILVNLGFEVIDLEMTK